MRPAAPPPFLALLLALLLPACAATSGQDATQGRSGAHPSLALARDALARGATATALEIARGVLSAEPDNRRALLTAADAEATLGDRDGATAHYTRAATLSPDDPAPARGLGKLRLPEEPREAEAAFRAILAKSPRDAATLTDLGVALDLQGRHEEAQRAYREALTAAPGLPSATANLGLSLALSGRSGEGEDALRTAARAGKDNARMRADLAVAQVIAGHDEEARRTLQATMTADDARDAVAAMRAIRPD